MPDPVRLSFTASESKIRIKDVLSMMQRREWPHLIVVMDGEVFHVLHEAEWERQVHA